MAPQVTAGALEMWPLERLAAALGLGSFANLLLGARISAVARAQGSAGGGARTLGWVHRSKARAELLSTFAVRRSPRLQRKRQELLLRLREALGFALFIEPAGGLGAVPLDLPRKPVADRP